MNECLVTKLKGVVDNNNLPYFGGLVLTVIPNPGNYDLDKDYSIKLYGATKIKIIGTGSVYLFNEAVTVTDEHDIVGNCYMKCAPGDYKVVIISKYDITSTGYFSGAATPYGRGIYYDLADLAYSKTGNISANGAMLRGELINKNPLLTRIYIESNITSPEKQDYKVNVESLEGCNMTEVAVRNSYSYGDINTVKNCVGLTSLDLPYTNVSGDIKTFCLGQVAAGRTSGTIRLAILGSKLSYNGMPFTNSDEAEAAVGIHSYVLIINFDSSAPDGFYITSA